MKTFIFLMAVVIVGLALASAGGGGESSSAQGSANLEVGVQTIDSVLERGLSQKAHQTLSEKAHASADWIEGIVRQNALDATQ